MVAAAGYHHTAAVGRDGTLFVWGHGNGGLLGPGGSHQRLTPTRVDGLPAPVRQVSAGYSHAGVVTDAGDLLMFGYGKNGRLGLGDEVRQTTPKLVKRALFADAAMLMVACGANHTAALTECGGVYTFGHGEHGMLGHGDEEDQLAPRRVPAAWFNDERVVMVAAGPGHTVALSEAGHVFTWGDGKSGQLGHNDREHQWAPRQVEAVWFRGDKVVFVAAGDDCTVAVTAGGRLYTWGMNYFGQLGHGDHGMLCDRLVPTLVGAGTFGGSAMVMAACGNNKTLVVTRDGALWACGRLGRDEETYRDAFVRVGAEKFGGARVVAATVGVSHSVAVTEDGALWTWGAGTNWQLGHGDTEDRWVPMRVAAAEFGDVRVGRGWGLSAEHSLAFAMGTHGRLGAASPVRSLAGEVELLRMIAPACHVGDCRLVQSPPGWVSWSAGKQEGVVRLLGGGLMLESVMGLADFPLDSDGEGADESEEDSAADSEGDTDDTELDLRFLD